MAGVVSFPCEPEAIQLELLRQWGYANSSTVFRKAAVELVGGYRPSLPYQHDYDLQVRLCEGFDAVNLPEPLMRRRKWAGQLTSRFSKEERRPLYQRVRHAMWQRRLTGRDDLDPSAPETGVLHMETRTRDEAAALYRLWARWLAAHPWDWAREAAGCAARAMVLQPWNPRNAARLVDVHARLLRVRAIRMVRRWGENGRARASEARSHGP